MEDLKRIPCQQFKAKGRGIIGGLEALVELFTEIITINQKYYGKI